MSDQLKESYANQLVKFAGVAVGVIYAIGFLVVARHLSRYGVSSLAVLQLQYLVAGIWTVSPPITFALVQRAAEAFKDHAWRSKPFRWHRALLIPAMTAIPFALSFYVGYLLLGSDASFRFGTFRALYVSYLALAYPADLAWMSWRISENGERWWLNRRAVPYYLTLFGFGILLWALYFGTSVYPSIPTSLGGGKPRTIVFIPGKDGLPLSIVKDNSLGRSVPYKLLAVTEKSYVVISPVPNEQSIEIDRNAIQGIVVLKEAFTP